MNLDNYPHMKDDTIPFLIGLFAVAFICLCVGIAAGFGLAMFLLSK